MSERRPILDIILKSYSSNQRNTELIYENLYELLESTQVLLEKLEKYQLDLNSPQSYLNLKSNLIEVEKTLSQEVEWADANRK